MSRRRDSVDASSACSICGVVHAPAAPWAGCDVQAVQHLHGGAQCHAHARACYAAGARQENATPAACIVDTLEPVRAGTLLATRRRAVRARVCTLSSATSALRARCNNACRSALPHADGLLPELTFIEALAVASVRVVRHVVVLEPSACQAARTPLLACHASSLRASCKHSPNVQRAVLTCMRHAPCTHSRRTAWPDQ